MKTIQVNASTTYPIHIGADLLSQSGSLCLDALGAPCKLCVVSDTNVAPLYLQKTEDALVSSGFEVCSFVFPNGEASKNTATLIELLEFLAEHRLTRSDAIVALGGGVVGDLSGFAAAVYLRGIRFLQIPTTLLAAVDSSVGGKTAVDLRAGKNLAGAFHQPSAVICDVKTLDTLSDAVFADGCAEVVKYGVINDRAFFESLRSGVREQIEQVIAACVQNKSRIVEGDEFDRGARQLLNLGHTVGHAVEACSNFEISHGSAVAIGMAVVTRAAVRAGLCPASDLDSLLSLLTSLSLPTECPYTARELCAIASADKKRSGAHITLVVPYGIGDCRLERIELDALEDFVAMGLN